MDDSEIPKNLKDTNGETNFEFIKSIHLYFRCERNKYRKCLVMIHYMAGPDVAGGRPGAQPNNEQWQI